MMQGSIQKRRTNTSSASSSPQASDHPLHHQQQQDLLLSDGNMIMNNNIINNHNNISSSSNNTAAQRSRKSRRQRRRTGEFSSPWIQYVYYVAIFIMAAIVGWKLVDLGRSLVATMFGPTTTKKTGRGSPRQLIDQNVVGKHENSNNNNNNNNNNDPNQILSSTSFQLVSEFAPTCRELTSEDVDFTLVTQLSQDRLWMIKHHCERYPHPISIAIYSNATLKETEDQLQKMGCDLQFVTVTIIDSRTVGSAEDYPVNILRNAALERVQTTHIIYVDVDFWLSEGLYDILHQENVVKALIADSRLALVLPAFMLFRQCLEVEDCRDHNIPLMPKTRKDLLQMMVDQRGHIFDPTNRGGHGSTLYKQWIRQETASLMEIPCLKSHRYEPFVVVRLCSDLPPFPAPFTGYGKNKLAWMMHVIRNGYTLSQVGGAFVVHYPHLESTARVKWNEGPKELEVHQKHNSVVRMRQPEKSDGNLNFHSFKRGQVDELFVTFRRWLETEVADHSRLEMCTDAQDDDSKLWIDNKPMSKKTTTTKKNEAIAKQEAKAAAIVEENLRIEQEAANVNEGVVAAGGGGGIPQDGGNHPPPPKEEEEEEEDADEEGEEDDTDMWEGKKDHSVDEQEEGEEI